MFSTSDSRNKVHIYQVSLINNLLCGCMPLPYSTNILKAYYVNVTVVCTVLIVMDNAVGGGGGVGGVGGGTFFALQM